MITVDSDFLGTNYIKVNGETLIAVYYAPELVDNAKQEELTRRIVEMLDPLHRMQAIDDQIGDKP